MYDLRQQEGLVGPSDPGQLQEQDRLHAETVRRVLRGGSGPKRQWETHSGGEHCGQWRHEDKLPRIR